MTGPNMKGLACSCEKRGNTGIRLVARVHDHGQRRPAVLRAVRAAAISDCQDEDGSGEHRGKDSPRR